MVNITDVDHLQAASKIKELMAIYTEAKDLIDVGAYQKGNNPKIDLAIKFIDKINEFLKQSVNDYCPYEQIESLLKELYHEITEMGR
jgi:flagellum-specific ATP synthase